MSIVTAENRSRLERNPNVSSVTTINIGYTSDFKKSALQQYEEGVIGRLIWANAGFNTDDFLSDYFRKVLKRWQAQANKAGTSDWTVESRGIKKRTVYSCDREELEYLRAENKLLKEVYALGKKNK